MLKFAFPIDKGNQSDGFIHFIKCQTTTEISIETTKN